MAQNLARALPQAYGDILTLLAEVAEKDVSAGVVESTFLLKNEAWVPLTVKFVKAESDLGMLGTDPTPKSIRSIAMLLPTLGANNLMEAELPEWLSTQFTLAGTFFDPVRCNFGVMREAKTISSAANLMHPQAPPYHYTYSKVFQTRGSKSNKQASKKRETTRHDDQPAKKQQTSSSTKQSEEFPTLEDTRHIQGKKGKGKARQSIPRGGAAEQPRGNPAHRDKQQWRPKEAKGSGN